ncbi:CAMK/CAMKL/GIN4 protein kinase [Trichophyton interdigitale MR816]|uniref:non-specific serine/threonine protein kinase n=1 Tax=Trichophyton interdigitale (strain MR816) TaxID=1215338 RepID=A0A059J5P7_TRIIM|nr:CAMK/CAMKL/GIN4 protein kinase [Trichophyton interdigitale H6]KDB22812.1 CAMK/CAMKL/GIN4 protein kinase [Trichophyton interdigitale MR816]
MEIDSTSNRSQQSRPPFGDAQNRANMAHPNLQRSRHITLSPSFEKLNFDGPNSKSNESTETTLTPVENKRISAILEDQPNSNRNSTISTASTTSTKSRRKTHIGPWQLGRTLGKGSTGRVRLAKHAVTGQSAAIKIVSKRFAAMVQSQSIMVMDKVSKIPGFTKESRAIPCGIEREVVIMKLIQHPNVIGLFDVWENRGELYLVLEYVEGGELFEYISEHGPLPEIEAVRLFRQIISAVSYCHRFNICHRDLKPENILLDGSFNVKLADFGMAALQPEGHMLNTSCGSPHYASPEIIYGKPYRGDKADIWSCGIILYALLCGFLPFDGGDLRNTLKLVKKGEYMLPPWMSEEAIDLVQSILQKDPENRITLTDMWEHPLLKKYENHPLLKSGLAIGLAPPLPLRMYSKVANKRQDINVEILRNLQTLWHAVDSEELIKKLLDEEGNLEKVFYRSLQKFREAQLEASGELPLKHSSSDYHHAPTAHIKGLFTPPQSWKGSRFSLAGGGSLKDGTYREPSSLGTISTYDPYRSSQTPTPNPRAEFANVTIHRRPTRMTGTAPSPLPNSPNLTPGPPSSYTVIQGFSSQKTSLASFRSYSSLGSSRCHTTGSKHIRYRRNVSFRHLHNLSGNHTPVRKRASTSASQYSLCTSKPAAAQTAKAQAATKPQGQSPNHTDSPTIPTPPLMARKRDPAKRDNVAISKARLSWREDARKVSAELEKLCEEAFNQVSDSSSATKGSYESKGASDTSSMSSISSTGEPEPKVEAIKDLLPKQPQESPRTYAALELAEARRRLIEHSAQAGVNGLPDYLKNVIAHLDRLIDGETASSGSKPMTKQTLVARESTGRLPVISEENYFETESKSFLPPPEPTKPLDLGLDNWETKKSIRVVNSDSMKNDLDSDKPLTVQKKHTGELPSLDCEFKSFDFSGYLASGRNEDNATSPRDRVVRHDSGLDSIDENPNSARSSAARNSDEAKKWTWLKPRQNSSDTTDTEASRDMPFTDLLDRMQEERRKSAFSHIEQHFRDLGATAGGLRLKKLFRRKKAPGRIHKLTDDADETDVISTISDADSKPNDSGVELDDDSTAATTPMRKNSDDIPLTTASYTNTWFSRFMLMKPAFKVLALNISKPRAKKEVVKLFKEWKKYGLEGLHLDNQNDIICGSVGELNFLRLRPVQFSAEFFSVLEHGRHANLSLIRLRQDQGASSSFYKVVQTLRMTLKERNFLVQDTHRAKKMIKVLS